MENQRVLIQINYLLPLTLDMVDNTKDIYDASFMLGINEDPTAEYFLDESGFVLKKIEGSFLPLNIHAENISLLSYEENDGKDGYDKDITMEYILKFTNGRVVNVDLKSTQISDSNIRINNFEIFHDLIMKKRNAWYNKYIFDTNFCTKIKLYSIIWPIHFIKVAINSLFDKVSEDKYTSPSFIKELQQKALKNPKFIKNRGSCGQ